MEQLLGHPPCACQGINCSQARHMPPVPIPSCLGRSGRPRGLDGGAVPGWGGTMCPECWGPRMTSGRPWNPAPSRQREGGLLTSLQVLLLRPELESSFRVPTKSFSLVHALLQRPSIEELCLPSGPASGPPPTVRSAHPPHPSSFAFGSPTAWVFPAEPSATPMPWPPLPPKTL